MVTPFHRTVLPAGTLCRDEDRRLPLSDGLPDPLHHHRVRSLVELSRRVEQQG